MSRFSNVATSALVAGSLTVSGAALAQDETVSLQLANAYPTAANLVGPAADSLAADIERLSGGTIEVETFAPGALLPPAEYFDALSSGALDAAFIDTLPWTGKDIAFAMFTNVPFGPGAPEFLAWMRHGGGQEQAQNLFHAYGIEPIACGLIAPEGGGWYKEPIESVEDFDGLKFRVGGLGGNVLQRLGVAAQNLGGGEVLQALQLGMLDGAEYSMPSIDKSLGFQSVAKYYYFPAWQSQSTIVTLQLSKPKWDSMSEAQQNAVRDACELNIISMLAEGEFEQAKAMQELQEAGVEFLDYPQEVLDALRESWEIVAQEQAERSPKFAEVWESYSAFREEYSAWGERGYLK
ncbi:MAG: TRAP transporter substrate-binding protein [Pseudomonadota bacterium]|nr:TRAP transporter substrate-binding protein [Pseudomonadota bacterium]